MEIHLKLELPLQFMEYWKVKMANTYKLLYKYTFLSSGSSVTYNSVSQNYTDIIVRVSLRSDQSGTVRAYRVQTNGVDPGTGWRLGGEGAGVPIYGDSGIGNYLPGTGTTNSNVFGIGETIISNYSSSTQNKQLLTESASTNTTSTSGLSLVSVYYNSNTPISTLVVYPTAGNFVAGSIVSFYGVSKS